MPSFASLKRESVSEEAQLLQKFFFLSLSDLFLFPARSFHGSSCQNWLFIEFGRPFHCINIFRFHTHTYTLSRLVSTGNSYFSARNMFRRLWSGLPKDPDFPSDLKGLG